MTKLFFLMFLELLLILFTFLPLLDSLKTPNTSSFIMGTKIQAFREAELLQKTGQLLYHRYLGNTAEVSELITNDIHGYGQEGKESLLKFIKSYDFDFPVHSIQVYHHTGRVKVEYDEEYSPLILSEDFYFDERQSTLLSQIITTTLPPPISPLRPILPKANNSMTMSMTTISQFFRPKILQCGGADSESSIRALKSVRILKLGTEFLSFDLKRDVIQQAEYFLPESIAFGEIGKENILKRQLEGVQNEVYYTIPFPLQVNIDGSCISMDFYAYRPDQPRQRGTDILFLDMYFNKVLRIDTLRHTLHQPEWVRKHFQH